MDSFVDILGLGFFEGTFCFSFVFLLYVTSCQQITQSCLLFIVFFISYYIIRRKGAKKLPAKGKHVLITGCDSGFGNGIARLLDRKGMIVFATCLSGNSDGAIHLKETGSKRMHVLQMDVTSDDSVAACIQKVKSVCQNDGLWTLINNAGISYGMDCELIPMSMYKQIAEVNLFGVVRVCKAFLPLVRKSKGRVVNVTSIQGLQALWGLSAYGISKFGAEGFSDCLRLEMRRFGVKVSIVEPGKFGLATAQNTEENVQKKLGIFKGAIDALSDDIRKSYGEEYLNLHLDITRRQKPGASDRDIKGVLDALEEAVLSSQPHARYLVDGNETRIDISCMLARLSFIIPTSLMDYVILSFRRPLPKEAFYSIEKKTN